MATIRFAIPTLVSMAAALLAVASCTPRTRPPADPLAQVAVPTTAPGWVRFRADADVPPREFVTRHAGTLQLAKGTQMRLVAEDTDELGITHLRYQQYFQDVEVEGAQLLVHARGNRAISANGKLAREFAPGVVRPGIDEAQALAEVRRRMGPGPYYKDDHLADDIAAGPSGATPRGTLVFVPLPPGERRVLAWRFNVYVRPLDRSRRLYVDAATGAIIKEIPLLPNCFTTTAATSFRGNQAFNTARAGIPGLGERFVLMDDCHANQLHALSFNFTSGSSREIFDDDNDWSGTDTGLITSFWALGVAYDFYDLVLKRKGYDNKNADMVIVNDPNLGQNANGGGGVINIGVAGPGSGDDYNTTDIVGHEYTHNVIETSAKLGYDATQESAALNESFSDIFGEMTEAWEESTTTPDWVIGADKGCTAVSLCRSLVNPKAFSQPDFYQGNFWQSGAGIDPHNNGTVQNRWFVLVAAGGNGTDETGAAYTVTGIGIAKAQKIAYRNLVRYLTAASDYASARDGSIQAAIDLYGDGSTEEGAVTQAWCAVGLCPFAVPSLADRFDRPGGNPNPASPDNNNTASGATPIAPGDWTAGKRPTLAIADLNLFPVGDVDYFRITLPEVSMLGGKCFPSGVALGFSAPADVQVSAGGKIVYSAHDTTSATLGGSSGTFLVRLSSPFPGLVLDYDIRASFYQRIDPHCWQTEPPTVFEQIQDCPMCNIGILRGPEEIILDPDYRRPDLIAPDVQVFRFGGGDLRIPVTMTQGNGRTVELMDSNGRVVQSASRSPGSPQLQVGAADLPAGIYSLRFSGYGNGTKIRVDAPTGP
jgi:Zn-dependent metalloprotease